MWGRSESGNGMKGCRPTTVSVSLLASTDGPPPPPVVINAHDKLQTPVYRLCVPQQTVIHYALRPPELVDRQLIGEQSPQRCQTALLSPRFLDPSTKKIVVVSPASSHYDEVTGRTAVASPCVLSRFCHQGLVMIVDVS